MYLSKDNSDSPIKARLENDCFSFKSKMYIAGKADCTYDSRTVENAKIVGMK